MPARVVLAMSGGVDSSVAAYLLKQQGYEVIGLFMRTGVHAARGRRHRGHKKGCCSAVDAGDARRVADRLDIPFYALDFEDDFGRIMDYFADEYLAGRTPNPCVVCNNWLKFGKLWSYGKQLDADFIATGHYAQMRRRRRRRSCTAAPIRTRTSRTSCSACAAACLPHLLFPIGGYRKDEVRAMAREAGLGVADKPDSVEICFVPDNDHAAFIRERRPELADGRQHRRSRRATCWPSTTASSSSPSASARASASARPVAPLRAGDRAGDATTSWSATARSCWRRRCVASRVNWLIEPPAGPLACQAKIRYRHDPAAATVTPLTTAKCASISRAAKRHHAGAGGGVL